MQFSPARMVARGALAAALMTGVACVKELSSEERLERATHDSVRGNAPTAEELSKLTCADAPDVLGKARKDSLPELERLQSYTALYKALAGKVKTFEEAMARNPDLRYREGSQQLVAAKDLCIQHLADVRVEYDRLVRDLVEIPTVQEIKGGTTVVIARIDFDALREAILALDPPDREVLLLRMEDAATKVGTTSKINRRRK